MALELSQETVWFDKWRYDDAEENYHEQKSTLSEGNCGCQDSKLKESLNASVAPLLGSLAHQIARAREDIQNSRAASGSRVPVPAAASADASADVINRVTKLEGENASLRNTVKSLEQSLSEITKRLSALECGATEPASTTTTAAKTTKPEPIEEDDDEDVDLFGSDEEEEDADTVRVREERLKAYADKKSKKAGPIAKSSVLLDCKPWDDETDLKIMEAEIRKIKMDGLVWGAAKQVLLAFGIHKLSILCTVEDEKVSIDDLSEKIQEIEDYVQSVDIAAFNKI